MADELPSIGGDSGPVEAVPVILVDTAGDPYTIGGSGGTAGQVQGNVADNAAAGATPNVLLVGGKYQTTPDTYTDGDAVVAHMGTRGAAHVQLMAADGTATPSIAAMTADAVSSGTQAMTVRSVGYVYNGTTIDRLKKPNATSRIVSAANTTNATSAKASAGDAFKAHGYNASASVRFLKLYNKASAPTVGTDTPVMTLALAPTAMFDYDLGGIYFSTGIAYAMTTGAADNDTGALTAADVLGLNIVYA